MRRLPVGPRRTALRSVLHSRRTHRALAAGHPAAADEQLLHLILVLAEIASIANSHREAIASFDGLRDGAAAEGNFDRLLNIADADAVAGRLLAVGLDDEVAFAGVLLGDDVAGAGHFLQHLLDRGELG